MSEDTFVIGLIVYLMIGIALSLIANSWGGVNHGSRHSGDYLLSMLITILGWPILVAILIYQSIKYRY